MQSDAEIRAIPAQPVSAPLRFDPAQYGANSHLSPLSRFERQAPSGPSTPSYGSEAGSVASGSHSQRNSSSADNPSPLSSRSWIPKVEAYKLIVEEMFRQLKKERLVTAAPFVVNGVACRLGRNKYTYYPPNDDRLLSWVTALHLLNPEAAFTLTSSVAASICAGLEPGTTEVILTDEDFVQVVETTEGLGKARKAQGACFVRTQGCLVVWADTVQDMVEAGRVLEKKMIKYIWRRAKASNSPYSTLASTPSSAVHSARSSAVGHGSTPSSGPSTPFTPPSHPAAALTRPFRKFFSPSGPATSQRLQSATSLVGSEKPALLGPTDSTAAIAGLEPSPMINEKLGGDPTVAAAAAAEAGGDVPDEEGGQPAVGSLQRGRTVNLYGPLYTGIGVGLNILLAGLLARRVITMCLLDGSYLRLAVLAVIPAQMLICQFLCDNIVGIVAQVFMPIAQLNRNSLYYSGKRSPRLPAGSKLPHFTVQMPVYKEGLDSVLAPTIESVKKAVAVYELQGGTANILVSEDGMQLLSPEEQEVRRDYYERNMVGWVARPRHGDKGYLRKGRFKKASNLNFTCNLSMRIEEIMDDKRPEATMLSGGEWYDEDEKALYATAMQQAIDESEGKAWAAGDIRIGDYILLIDSDTRVPADCFLDAASELEQSPEVGVLQHSSGVMYVANHFFEKMIGYFTEVVNLAISWSVANGGVAPFVGHNAFLRWRAAQQVIFTDDDGERCVWSSAHVSEDFDMALRLLMKGYVVRWATYSNNQFLEGVSLTADDELNRWQKYAYGCSELVLNPLRKWPTRGPLSPLFKKFLWSDCSTTYKFNACSYIFSYWAIAVGTPMTVAMYFAMGLFWPLMDPIPLPPLQIWFTVVFVFSIFGTFAQLVFRARASRATFVHALVQTVKWTPMLCVFFGGLGYHVMLALLAHPFEYNMTWSATVKDVEESNFWKEIPAIFKRFGHCIAFMVLFAAAMVVMGSDLIPLEWRILEPAIYAPAIAFVVAHLVYPFVLNPWLVRFEF
ncbi:uncharacterized protein PFL1_04447 [Pseudozyma flocculosa PF-1]|uniref:Uncharacterized protein n=2 Tax=Pseudozyma flocculosa TaxID=84751 RepID=A0A5C3FE48_9BASI|nr:uncharacterized protein PFL1_04447 [Pseudozyma flocculosa PF-1]EPQ28120.1 hypothetical protein PFL1_04447 [Pseudozyma flocculosa PF-1]SPO41917.1 uncharacterized protein PSFLO_07400 [Pseudozyma flocculosa]